jgi:hypothetical protein
LVDKFDKAITDVEQDFQKKLQSLLDEIQEVQVNCIHDKYCLHAVIIL